MGFTYLTLITLFLIINCFFNLFLIKNECKFNKISTFNSIIFLFIILSLDNYNTVYLKLLLILIYLTLVSYSFFKLNKHLIVIFSITKLWVFNSILQIDSILNLIILLEFIN